MSLLKMVPEGLKPRQCERVKLCKPLPVPYVPTKDEVQDEVTRMQSLEIKTMIKKDTTLNFAVWQGNGTREAFLMHVTAVLDANKNMVMSRTTRWPRRNMREPRKPLSLPRPV
jgi:hypothetical protein